MHIEIGFLVINLRAYMRTKRAVGAGNAAVEFRELTADPGVVSKQFINAGKPGFRAEWPFRPVTQRQKLP
jgi:hypothetical protein